MAKPIHMMIRVLDEEKSVRFYENAFGLKVADRYAFDGFTLVYLSNQEQAFEVELTINHDRKELYELGTGYGHIAFAVPTSTPSTSASPPLESKSTRSRNSIGTGR